MSSSTSSMPSLPSLTAGKKEVTVRFQAHPECMAGGVFGLSMLRLVVEKRE